MHLNRNEFLAISTTAFFNDRGCHIRIENVMNSLHINKLICYGGGRERRGIDTIRAFSSSFDSNDYIGFNLKKFLLDFLVLRKTLIELRKKRFRYIIAFTHEAGIVAMILKSLRKIPFILDYQGSLIGEMKTYTILAKIPLINYFIKSIEYRIENKAGLIITNTKFNYDAVNVHNKKMINDEYYPPVEKHIASFREADEIIVLWVGLMTERQGFDYLTELMRKLGKRTDKIKFIVIGHSDDIAELQSRHQNAVFTGRINFEYLPDTIRDADICISTKRESMEGSHKLIMFRRYCKRVLSLNSNAAREILNKDDIVETIDEMEEKIMELL